MTFNRRDVFTFSHAIGPHPTPPTQPHTNSNKLHTDTQTTAHQHPWTHPLPPPPPPLHTRALNQHHTHTKTHTNTGNLTDSSAALIADLNRPGDLSLSLTHSRHTSFFIFFSSPSLPLFFFSPCPNNPSLSPSVTLHQLIPVPLLSPIIFTRNALASFVSCNKGVNIRRRRCSHVL